MKFEYHSKAKLALNEELRHHPDILEMLSKNPDADFEIKLALIYGYFGILIEGDFYPAEVDRLADRVRDILIQRRKIIIQPPTERILM